MIGYMLSLLMGVAAGVAYGLVQVRSPAPPLIALVGLLGMVVGERMINTARHHFAPASTPIAQADDAHLDPHGRSARQMPNRIDGAARSP
ncbi:DUF1427 family protein [Bradyrhizobium septentrionale]|uniref:DUF1427 family protein n=1 Tax=Bradyrhizobium septentrionale TaxID=1404411 RepID=A0A973W6T4_9BRAD|nr:DUF1427 family protein [Bradyrhizobium septentrionale]UGY17286.1 XapX domain-containing protein [Bradyrhizobium septentrionale]UGY26029.1 XapX domain-containing protein [Bradyrhizobium septentrionale]